MHMYIFVCVRVYVKYAQLEALMCWPTYVSLSGICASVHTFICVCTCVCICKIVEVKEPLCWLTCACQVYIYVYWFMCT